MHYIKNIIMHYYVVHYALHSMYHRIFTDPGSRRQLPKLLESQKDITSLDITILAIRFLSYLLQA